MKQREDGHQKIINEIKKLPEINDDLKKETLYNRISSDLSSHPNSRKRKNNKLLPIVAASSVTALIFITFFFAGLFPFKQNTDLTSNQDTNSPDNETKEVNLESDNKHQGNELQYSESEEVESFVVQDLIPSPFTIVYGAAIDEQQQFVVPISFIVEESADLNQSYNDMEHFIDDEKWGLHENLLSDALFQLSDTEVIIELDNDFSLTEGSADAYMLERLLSTMFTPYGIGKAVFRTEKDGNENIEELPLGGVKNVSYKLYRNQFLVPISNSDNLSISEAISEMKVNEEEFSIDQTVPSDIEMDIQSEDDQLALIFEEDTTFDNNQEAIVMVESLLMTAKSFGFQTVQFHNSPLTQIGDYNLNAPIAVPEAVNPVDLRK